MKLQNFIRGRPSQDKPGNLQYEILSLAGPAKSMDLTESSSKFSSGASPVTTNQAICSAKISSLACLHWQIQDYEPVKTRNLEICNTKILSQASPAKTVALTKWPACDRI